MQVTHHSALTCTRRTLKGAELSRKGVAGSRVVRRLSRGGGGMQTLGARSGRQDWGGLRWGAVCKAH